MDNDKVTYLRIMGFEFPIHHAKLVKYTLIVYVLLVAICQIAIRYFGYEMTDADIPGGLVAGFLVAYLVTII